jgi:hypothetical protein
VCVTERDVRPAEEQMKMKSWQKRERDTLFPRSRRERISLSVEVLTLHTLVLLTGVAQDLKLYDSDSSGLKVVTVSGLK